MFRYQVDNVDISNQERYMHICGKVGFGQQRCPSKVTVFILSLNYVDRATIQL